MSIECGTYDPSKIRIEKKQLTIAQVEHWIDLGALKIPEIDNRSIEDKSSLIESIMVSIPISSFYLDEDEKGIRRVVKGAHRLSVIHEYLNDGFQLKGMKYLENCEDKAFSQLPIKFRRRMEETILDVFIIDARCPSEIKKDIFRRINAKYAVKYLEYF